jgi:hypothetical protein
VEVPKFPKLIGAPSADPNKGRSPAYISVPEATSSSSSSIGISQSSAIDDSHSKVEEPKRNAWPFRIFADANETGGNAESSSQRKSESVENSQEWSRLNAAIRSKNTGPSASMAPPKSKGIADTESATQKENTRWSNNVPTIPIGGFKKKPTQPISASNEFVVERNEEDTEDPEGKEISSILSGMKGGHSLKELYDQGMVSINPKKGGLTPREEEIDDNSERNEAETPVKYW